MTTLCDLYNDRVTDDVVTIITWVSEIDDWPLKKVHFNCERSQLILTLENKFLIKQQFYWRIDATASYDSCDF